jgi:hypothetical protein
MDLMPDYWLEVSLHPEGPATSQLDQGFLWLVQLVPKFHVALHALVTLFLFPPS